MRAIGVKQEWARKVSDSTLTLPTFDLARYTPYRVAIVAQLLSEALALRYREQFGISIPEWRVLVHLVHSGGTSVRDIEQKVVMEKSKVSRAAARLTSRGLIAKRPNMRDKRLLHLSLTEKGRQIMSDLLPIARSFQNDIEIKLGPDFAAFERAIEKILEGT
jgi:DNA-binding MarR family transcriptional regulator